jgi:hypothetical protein
MGNRWLVNNCLARNSSISGFSAKSAPRFAISNENVNLVALALNIVLFVIAIVSLIVALAAYQSAEQSGREQQQILVSSRQALESVVGVAVKQQGLLDRSLQVSESHLRLAEQARTEELERRGRRPKLEVSLGEISANDLRSAKRFNVARNRQGVVELGFFVKNLGNAPLIRPVILMRALPAAVALYPVGNVRTTRTNPNVFQFSGPTILDLLPLAQNPVPYGFSLEAVVPESEKAFDMEVRIFGENLSAVTLKIGFELIQSPR